MKVLLAILVLISPLISVASPSKRELSLNDADHKGNRLFKRKGGKKAKKAKKSKKSGKKSDYYYPKEQVYYPQEPIYYPQDPMIQKPVTIYIQSPSIPTEATIYVTKTTTYDEAVTTMYDEAVTTMYDEASTTESSPETKSSAEYDSETSSEESPSSTPSDDLILQPPVDEALAQELVVPEPNVSDLDAVSGTVILPGELAWYILLFLGIM